MGKAEIIKKISRKMYGNVNEKSIQQSTDFCDALEEVITEALINNKRVLWKGFINIEVVERAERKGRHPQTGEIFTFPATKSVKCKVSKAIRDLINGKQGMNDEYD